MKWRDFTRSSLSRSSVCKIYLKFIKKLSKLEDPRPTTVEARVQETGGTIGPDTGREGQVSKRPIFLLAAREPIEGGPVVAQPVEVEAPLPAAPVEVGQVEVAIRIAQERARQGDVAPLERGGDLLPAIVSEHPDSVREAEIAPVLAGEVAELLAAQPVAGRNELARHELRDVEGGRGDVLHDRVAVPGGDGGGRGLPTVRLEPPFEDRLERDVETPQVIGILALGELPRNCGDFRDGRLQVVNGVSHDNPPCKGLHPTAHHAPTNARRGWFSSQPSLQYILAKNTLKRKLDNVKKR